ncbi:MAG TPA: tRNA (adenosine(37)-N6)-dimethylallyltransferase MiaA [Myxococcaceae bacterium]|nr:tRNA (adenosine(37)-N6)-dimethylallyltransferase MiaA [Myxococcaceae bacterium]
MTLTVIAGPTASGKSALALGLAERTGGEIVSADSQQVYRHFDIGTAKPTAEERARVPHHLISIVEPGDAFSAGRYQELADAAIADITRRGGRPIVVGGTGLYLRFLLHGVIPAPQADPAVRARFQEELRARGVAGLYADLLRVDPVTAAATHATDAMRITRVLEIHAQTGQPASMQRRAHGFAERRHEYRLFVLDPPREALNAAIDARTRRMFASGLVEEVKRLVALGHENAAPMRSVGYAQALQVLRGALTVEEAIAAAAQATRRYAKRQRTWFRKEKGAEWIAPPYAEIG